eukprot:scaffold68083_cov32-Prasinocladus_malaysianus.AAC.2
MVDLINAKLMHIDAESLHFLEGPLTAPTLSLSILRPAGLGIPARYRTVFKDRQVEPLLL